MHFRVALLMPGAADSAVCVGMGEGARFRAHLVGLHSGPTTGCRVSTICFVHAPGSTSANQDGNTVFWSCWPNICSSLQVILSRQQVFCKCWLVLLLSRVFPSRAHPRFFPHSASLCFAFLKCPFVLHFLLPSHLLPARNLLSMTNFSTSFLLASDKWWSPPN